MPFAALALARLRADATAAPRRGDAAPRRDWRLIALGALIGLAALTRNEATFIGFAWLVVVWWRSDVPGRRKAALVAVPAVVALAVFAPWLVRNWIEFGNPLPSQTLSNALSVEGFDIFAWSDPPTLSRYLAVGPARLLEMRVEGTSHNLLTVLLIPGFPTSFVGLIALPFFVRLGLAVAARDPVADDVPRHEPALPGLDDVGDVPPRRRPGARAADRVGAARARTRSSSGSGRCAAGRDPWPGSGRRSRSRRRCCSSSHPRGCRSSVASRMASRPATRRSRRRSRRSAGRSPSRDRSSRTSRSGWAPRPAPSRSRSRTSRPSRSPTWPGTSASRLVVVVGDQHGDWPAILDAGGPSADCFREIDLPTPDDPAEAEALDEVRVFEVVCP